MRHVVLPTILCFLVCAGLLFSTALPTHAQAGPPWGSEQAFVDWLRSSDVRHATAVIEGWVDLWPNVTRSHLEAAVPVIGAYGYDADFARCAVEGTITVQAGDQRRWYYREQYNSTNITWVPISQFFLPGTTLQVFKYGNAFVAKACGNFSVPPVMKGTLRVRKFDDSNMNGVWDSGEPELHWEVSYTGPTSGSGTTPLAVSVPIGNYTVTEDTPEGWEPTTSTSQSVPVEACDTTTVIFGNVELGSISGLKWDDTNCDGVVDEDDAGLEEWQINLFGENIAGDFLRIPSVLTNEAGEYLFDDLCPSDAFGYIATETLKEDAEDDWGPTWPLDPGLTYVPERLPPWYHTIVLGEGDDLTNVNFGNVKLGSISGFKFYDANPELPVNHPWNGNGIWDPGEVSIANCPMRITGYTDLMLPIVPRTTYTDENGEFTLAHLYPSHVDEGYTICEEPPEGWLLTYPQAECRSTHLDEGEDISEGFEFGNIAVVYYGLRTIGYWKTHPEAITKDMYRALKDLPAFAHVNNWKKLEPILWDATAEDMAMMLRAQLAAMELNVLAGIVPLDATIYVGDIAGAPELFGGNIVYLGTILTVIESAYPWDGWDRATKEAAKDALDHASNNESTVSVVPVAMPPAPTVDVHAAIHGPPDGSLSTDIDLRFYDPTSPMVPLHGAVVSLDGSGYAATKLILPVGTYEVRAKAPTHLARRITGWTFDPSDPAVIDFGRLLAGDLVNDNFVDQADFEYMSWVWRTDDPIADINRDGLVNVLDFSLLNANWHVSGDE